MDQEIKGYKLAPLTNTKDGIATAAMLSCQMCHRIVAPISEGGPVICNECYKSIVKLDFDKHTTVPNETLSLYKEISDHLWALRSKVKDYLDAEQEADSESNDTKYLYKVGIVSERYRQLARKFNEGTELAKRVREYNKSLD